MVSNLATIPFTPMTYPTTPFCDTPFHPHLCIDRGKDSWECKSLCSFFFFGMISCHYSPCSFVYSTIFCRELSKPLNRICLTPFKGPHRPSDGCTIIQLFLLQKSIHFAFNFYKQHITITRAFDAVPTL